jgi:hypothetical protein
MRAWVPVPKIEPCGDVDPDLTAPQVAAVCHDNPGLFGIVTRRPVLAWPAQPFRTPARDIVVCQVRRKLYRVTRTSRFFLNACPVASQPTRLQTTKAATPERNF